jgi:peptidoglycan hydrolase-like protein with peptidoglycan-binding domain
LTCTPASVSSISPSTISPSTPITKFLSLGSSDVQVLTLQKILSSLGYLKVTPTGFYGSLTQAAVESFQKANGIPTVGTVGPLTRTALNKYVTTASIAVPAASTVHIAQPQVSTPSVNGTFTRTLKLGSTGSDVTALQVFLNTHGFIVATSGNGSPGHESTYYGPATAAAVSRFQMAHALQILTPNGLTQGTGNFGPATMKAVNGMK